MDVIQRESKRHHGNFVFSCDCNETNKKRKIFRPVEAGSKIPLTIQIRRCIGFSNYRRDENCEAIICYIFSLNHIKSIKHDIGIVIYKQLAPQNNVVVILQSKSDDTKIAIRFVQDSSQLYENLDQPEKVPMIGTVCNEIDLTHLKYHQHEFPSVGYNSLPTIREHLSNYRNRIDIDCVICRKNDQDIPTLKNFLRIFHWNEIQQKSKREQQRHLAIHASNQASIHMKCGDLISALDLYKYALKATQSYYGVGSIETAAICNALGNVSYNLGNVDEALKYLMTGSNIEKAVYGIWHDNFVITTLNIAQIYLDKGDYEDAFLQYKQVYKIMVTKNDPHAISLSPILHSMGLMKYRMKAYDKSFLYYQKALYIQRKHIGEDVANADIAGTLNSIGTILFHWGKHDIAKSYFEESLSMRLALHGTNHPDVSILLFNLATIHLEMGDDENAILLYKETMKVERQLDHQTGPDLAHTLRKLGSMHHARGEFNEALSHLQEALDMERLRYGSKHIRVAMVLNLLGNIYLQSGNVNQMMDAFTEAARICQLHNERLVITGFTLYGFSKLHPECSAAA